MKLYEIVTEIEANRELMVERLFPYRKSLNVLYPNHVLMVTTVCNAFQSAKVVPANEFSEAIEEYVQTLEVDEETMEYEREVINFNSIMLESL